MPTKVTGEDGRVLHDNLNDQDAADLARRVHQNTGETVTLTPYKSDGAEWTLDHESARTVGAPVEEAVEEPVEETAPVTETPKRAPRAPKADPPKKAPKKTPTTAEKKTPKKK